MTPKIGSIHYTVGFGSYHIIHIIKRRDPCHLFILQLISDKKESLANGRFKRAASKVLLRAPSVKGLSYLCVLSVLTSP